MFYLATECLLPVTIKINRMCNASPLLLLHSMYFQICHIIFFLHFLCFCHKLICCYCCLCYMLKSIEFEDLASFFQAQDNLVAPPFIDLYAIC